MRHLSVFANGEEILLTDMCFKVRKKMLGPKKIFKNLVFGPYNFLCKKVTNIQIVTHAYLGRSSKNVLEVFHKDIAVCESSLK